jgi:hypothetical protein
MGWWVCVTLLVPARLPAPAGAGARAVPSAPVDPGEVRVKLDAYFGAAAASLPPGPRGVLPRIRDRQRRLLAVAHYIRRRDQLDTLWSWTGPQARAHQQTGEYGRAMTHIRQVQRRFAQLNPGYLLVADTNPRPLAVQLRYWNRDPSVLAAAGELGDSAGAWLAVETFPSRPDSSGLARFIVSLEAYRPSYLPTVAVPGLSLHGQLRAYDFAILRHGRVVAGPESATLDSVWDRGGWTERLRRAVAEAGGDFRGPLDLPREPWHYEHRPETP